MANRFIALLFVFTKSIFYKVLIFLSNANIKSKVKNTSGRFTIHYNVDIRTPTQIKFGNNLIIRRGCIVNGRSNKKDFGVEFGDEVYIKENCYIDSYGGSIKFVGHTAVGQYTMIAGQGGITIGKYVMIGGQVYILSSNHNFSSKEYPFMLQGDVPKEVIIEDNVWIGGGCIILGGVRIGKNSVIGAGSIVNKDVPANSIYVNSRSEPKITSIKYKEEQ